MVYDFYSSGPSVAEEILSLAEFICCKDTIFMYFSPLELSSSLPKDYVFNNLSVKKGDTICPLHLNSM